MAHTPWEPDGTQPPDPYPAWNDTGEPFRIEMAKPVEPDLSEVRRAVHAALGEEEDESPAEPVRRRESATTFTETPGIVPLNPRAGWPRNPSGRQLPGFRPRQPARIQRVRRPGSGGVAIATTVGVLLLVGVIITMIVMIFISLADTIDSIVN
ncbi:MAG TPA: hypothetical protein VFV67_26970 [Actinophytocola sp.]|uniref:hypothetical protein n=1 Tax=Actinophytocola sp. TaxID=1872138 RepID=UPI002DBBE29A|nr:hypothetical protein [Actinophytocola sp.]HEU5474307.1 hypothetical protein [Actinophytocola sp.]